MMRQTSSPFRLRWVRVACWAACCACLVGLVVYSCSENPEEPRPGICSVDSTDLDFGRVMSGRDSIRTFTVSHTGSWALRGMVRADTGCFAIVMDGTTGVDTASYWLDATNDKKVFSVRFKPDSTETEKTWACAIDVGSGCDSVFCTGTVTRVVVPEAPLNLRVTELSANQISLAWTDESEIEDGFSIYRETAKSFDPVDSVGMDDTTYMDTGLGSTTRYTYRVFAYNSAGESSTYSEDSATTEDVAPHAPSDLIVTEVTTDQITLQWVDNSANEEGFNIRRGPSATSLDAIYTTVRENVESFTDTGLEDAKEYFYTVSAYNGIGESAMSDTVSETTHTEPPASPTNLEAGAVSSSQIDLSWEDNSGNEEGFEIRREIENEFVPIGSVLADTTCYSDTGLIHLTLYNYRVYAFNAGGSSSHYTAASDTTWDTPPSAPSDLQVRATEYDNIIVSWKDNSDNEQNFYVLRGPSEEPGPCAILGANDTSYTDDGVQLDVTYCYRVYAGNLTGSSDATETKCATVGIYRPHAPSDLIVTEVTTDQITLSWHDGSTNEDGFIIYRGLSAGSVNTPIDSVGPGAMTGTMSHVDSIGLKPATEYFYCVYAFNDEMGESVTGACRSATTDDVPPAAPSELVAVAESSTEIVLTWKDNSHNEDEFRVYRGPGASVDSITALIATHLSGQTTHRDTVLDSATRYCYRVRARSLAWGSSSYSDAACATTPDVPPEPPSELVATPVSTSQINLSWVDNSDNEIGFNIYQEAGKDSVLIATAAADESAYANTGLTPGTTYNYWVSAYNTAGESSSYASASATTVGCAVDPTGWDFGVVVVGGDADKEFTITNTGGGTLADTVWVDSEHYGVMGDSTYSLASGESAPITVRFSPEDVGTWSCQVHVGSECNSVPCTGVAPVILTVEANQPVWVTVFPDDLNEESQGETPMVFRYGKDTVVSITVPETTPVNGMIADFVGWCPGNETTPTLSITLSEDRTIQAVYPVYDSETPDPVCGCDPVPEDMCCLCPQDSCGDLRFSEGPIVDYLLEITKGSQPGTIQAHLQVCARDLSQKDQKTVCYVDRTWLVVTLEDGWTIDKILGTTVWPRSQFYTDDDNSLDCFSGSELGCALLDSLCFNGNADHGPEPDVANDEEDCGCDRSYAEIYWKEGGKAGAIEFLKIPPPCE